MKTCPICQSRAGDGASTCFECLYSFADASARSIEPSVVPVAVPSIDSRNATSASKGIQVETVHGAHRWRVSSRRGSIYVGSATHNDIVVPGEHAASREIHLYQGEGHTWVEPLADSPHAIVNGESLCGATTVGAGDVVQIGPVSIRVTG